MSSMNKITGNRLNRQMCKQGNSYIRVKKGLKKTITRLVRRRLNREILNV